MMYCDYTRVDEHFLSIKEALFIFDHIYWIADYYNGHQVNVCTEYRLLRLLRLYSSDNQNFPNDEFGVLINIKYSNKLFIR